MPLMECTRNRDAWQSYGCQTLPDSPEAKPDPPTQPRETLGRPPQLARALRHVAWGGGVDKVC